LAGDERGPASGVTTVTARGVVALPVRRVDRELDAIDGVGDGGLAVDHRSFLPITGGRGRGTQPCASAGLSTVTAAGASVVTFDDIANLLNAVPAEDRYSGNCVVLLSPGAHIDLLQENPAMLTPWAAGFTEMGFRSGRFHGVVHGFPFAVDPALADPATTTKSVVAGNFRDAYLIRSVSLRVEQAAVPLNTDLVSLRAVLRADGRRMRTAACRALVHP
jgi:hypothetical protein